MRTKPSILFLNRVLYPEKGETGRVLRDISHAFAQDGWEVSVLSLHTTKEDHTPSNKLKIKTAKALFGKSLFGYLWAWVRLLSMAVTHPRTDIIVTMTDPPLLVMVGNIVSCLKGSRHVHWCQDLYPDLFPVLGYPKILKFLTHRLSVRALRKCDKIIVIGRCMARKIVNKNIPASHLSVIPNWYNPVQKKDLSEKRIKKKVETTIKAPKEEKDMIFDESQKFRVLYAGTIGRAHKMDTILGAIRQIQDLEPDIEFVFIGDKKGHDGLQKEKDRRGITNIRLIPYQPESALKALMESGDIHLISLDEHAEGLMVPSKFYSALAAGRPSIFVGPKNSEVSKVIRDFECGTLVSQNNEKRLVEAIQAYRNSEKRWFKHQEGALEAAQRFLPEQSWQVWLQRMQDLMRQP